LRAIPQLGLSKDSVVVTLLPDGGSRYLSKIFDDNWMRDNGFLNTDWSQGTVADFSQALKLRPVTTAHGHETVQVVIQRMKQHSFSQLPVVDDDAKLIGMISETNVLDYMLNNTHASVHETPIEPMVQPAVSVDEDTPLNTLSDVLQKAKAAVLVDADNHVHGIITMIDVIDFLAA
jgi:cystathionine beta-synthase